MSQRVAFCVLVLLCVVNWPEETQAQSVACSVTANPVTFGTYDPLRTSPIDSVGNVQVSCIGVIGLLISYTIALSAGSGGSFIPRRMMSGTKVLNYNLYTNASRSTVWGDGSSGTAVVSDGYLLVLLTVTRNYPVYGRLFASQNVPAGLYTDIITVTVNY